MRLPLILAAVLAAGPAFGQPSPKPAGCSSPESKQFDFWVGRWTVTRTGQAEVVAESLIEKLYLGCGVRENWMPRNGGGGGSLNIYLPGEKAWRQTWIDAGGGRADYKGTWTGSAMVFTGEDQRPDGKRQATRMTFTPAADGSVRQQGEASEDGGKTWKPDYDFTYRPATPQP